MIETDNHADVDLRSLRALVAVADQGSFRGAARELGYTQSAISHQIATLERSLETPLFTRPGGRGATALTPAGSAVYRRARRVLGEVQTLAADVQAAVTGERQTLRIGTFQTATTEVLPPGAARPARGAPGRRGAAERDPHQHAAPTTSSPTASWTLRCWSTRSPTSGSSRSPCSTTRG